MQFSSSKLLLAIFVALVIWPPVAQAVEKCESFSATGVDYWYPYIYQNTEGKLTGIIVDATEEALKRIGLKLDVLPSAPWRRILFQFQSARMDMVLGAYWNKERAAKFLYSESIGTEEIRVFVRAGKEFPLSSFDDLKGRDGLRLSGGSLGQKFDKFAEENLKFSRVGTNDQMIKMLDQDRADYGIQGFKQGLHFIKKFGLKNRIVSLPWPILTNDVYALINRNAPCANRIEELNATLREMKKEGYIEALALKHSRLEWGDHK